MINKYLLLALTYSPLANATFSIVAYDPNTNEYGVGFASCVELPNDFNSSDYLSTWGDDELGQGLLVTQGEVMFPTNELLGWGREMIRAGVDGDQVIDYLINNDPEDISEQRQYLLINDANDNGNKLNLFSGDKLSSTEGKVDINYHVIVGGNEVIKDTTDILYDAYVQASGSLQDRILKSLSSVEKNYFGDARCPSGISSKMAFIRINNYSVQYHSQHGEDAVEKLVDLITEGKKVLGQARF